MHQNPRRRLHHTFHDAKVPRGAHSEAHERCVPPFPLSSPEPHLAKPYPPPGQTLRDARHAYLADALLGSDGVFGAFGEWAKEDANKKIAELYDEVGAETGDIFASICAAFKQAKNRPENDTEEGRKFRAGLRELVAMAEGILEGVAHESLKMCLAWK
jgi:hypothetical protein